jgi:hypothetical protein
MPNQTPKQEVVTSTIPTKRDPKLEEKFLKNMDVGFGKVSEIGKQEVRWWNKYVESSNGDCCEMVDPDNIPAILAEDRKMVVEECLKIVKRMADDDHLAKCPLITTCSATCPYMSHREAGLRDVISALLNTKDEV